jgi:DNA-binding XRE family transcriptional regulator
MENKSSKLDKKERFIELRSREYSFDDIAKELGISKPTLISWSKELQYEVNNFRELNREALRNKLAIDRSKRLEMFAAQLDKLSEELAKRDLSEVPAPQLLNMIVKIENRISQIDDGSTNLSELSFGFDASITSQEDWAA